MALADDYADTIRKETNFFAAYPINDKIALGDYGVLRGNRWVRIGNIAEGTNPFPVTIEEQDGGNQFRWEFASRDTTSMKFGANVTIEAGLVSVKPGLKVEFNSDFGVYTLLGGTTVKKMRNFATIASEVKRRANLKDDDAQKWNDREWFLVSEVLTATNGVILMSRTRGGKVIVQVKGNVPNLDIANANLAFDVVMDTSASQQFIPEEPGKPLTLTPLFSLVYADRGIFGLESAVIRPKSTSVDPDAQPPGTVLRSMTPGSLADYVNGL